MTVTVRKSGTESFSVTGTDSELDFAVALRAELDNARLAAVGFKQAEVENTFGAVLDQAQVSLDVTCPGAAVGDLAFASISVNAGGLITTAQVTATNVVTVTLNNETTATITPGACTVRVAVLEPGRVKSIGLPGTYTGDAYASIADEAELAADFTVTGATLGDFVVASVSVDNVDLIVNAQVTAADTVTVVIHNAIAAGAVNLASATWYFLVLPKEPVLGSISLGAKVYNPASLGDGVGATTSVPCPGARLGDFVLVSFSLDVTDVLLSAHVASNDTVTVRFQNETTGTVNLAEGLLRVAAIPPMEICARQFVVDLNS